VIFVTFLSGSWSNNQLVSRARNIFRKNVSKSSLCGRNQPLATISSNPFSCKKPAGSLKQVYLASLTRINSSWRRNSCLLEEPILSRLVVVCRSSNVANAVLTWRLVSKCGGMVQDGPGWAEPGRAGQGRQRGAGATIFLAPPSRRRAAQRRRE